MKKIFASFLLYFSMTLSVYADVIYDHVVFFGDSLSDTGNLFSTDLGYLPKSPPYFNGRFTNGPTWTDYFTDYFKKNNVAVENYAVGGETTLLHSPFDGFLPYTLGDSVSSYNLHHLFKDKSHTLFVFWIGANDYLPGTKDNEQETTDVVNRIQSKIEEFIDKGAKQFLVVTLPDLATTPGGVSGDHRDQLHTLTLLHNSKLKTAVDVIRSKHEGVNINLYDVYDLFNDLTQHPEVYNQKYGTHFSNTQASCWSGGYTIRQLQASPQLIENSIAKDIAAKHLDSKVDPKVMAQYILKNPTLAEAYRVGLSAENGAAPCANPENYVFWDRVHPTTQVHQIFYTILSDFIDTNFPRG